MFMRLGILSLFLLFLGFISNCVTVQETERSALRLVPESQMNTLGAQAFSEIKNKEKRSPNREITEEVINIAQNVTKASGASYSWEFEVFENQEANAFCLPGGKIGVYTGILPIAANNAGLAAIIAHEVAHATLKHGTERVSQGLLVNLGIIAADLSLGNNQYRDYILAGLGLGAQVGVLLPYSRVHEHEADFVGMKYAAKAGYDPSEAVALWQRMAKQEKSQLPVFLSTHPDPGERAETLSRRLNEIMEIYQQSNKQITKKLLQITAKP